MAKWKEIPSPEAIVRAALERAAKMVETYCKERVSDCEKEDAHLLDAYAAGLRDEAEGLSQDIADRMCALASNPAEVAAIIKKAGEDRG
jgi:predicted ATPase